MPATDTLSSLASSVLIVIDVQYDFLPGGALAVANGDQIIPTINRLAALFPHTIATQDWHPSGHISFASTHVGHQPFDVIALRYGPQVLWPEHCVQESHGAALSSQLHLPRTELVIRKGYHPQIDSYSAFMEADRRTPTGLAGYLRERGFTDCYVCGLATDFCVAWTALDARQAGFRVCVVEDACKGIDINGSVAKAWADMAAAGVRRIHSCEIC